MVTTVVGTVGRVVSGFTVIEVTIALSELVLDGVLMVVTGLVVKPETGVVVGRTVTYFMVGKVWIGVTESILDEVVRLVTGTVT